MRSAASDPDSVEDESSAPRAIGRDPVVLRDRPSEQDPCAAAACSSMRPCREDATIAFTRPALRASAVQTLVVRRDDIPRLESEKPRERVDHCGHSHVEHGRSGHALSRRSTGHERYRLPAILFE